MQCKGSNVSPINISLPAITCNIAVSIALINLCAERPTIIFVFNYLNPVFNYLIQAINYLNWAFNYLTQAFSYPLLMVVHEKLNNLHGLQLGSC